MTPAALRRERRWNERRAAGWAATAVLCLALLLWIAEALLASANGCEREAHGPRDLNGLPHGEWRIVACDGTETIGTLDRGRWHGAATVKRPDGRVDIGAYAEGRKDGYWTYGAADGASTAGDYRAGLLDGEWVYRDRQGAELARECWKAGRMVNSGPCRE